MNRRQVLSALATSTALAVAPGRLSAKLAKADPNWDKLKSRLGPRLISVTSPLAVSAAKGGHDASALLARLRNPYLLGDEAGLTQTFGWVGAWSTQPSERAVVAESAADVATAIDFARATGVRLVVKGGGHSYLGNSNAAGSLLIWTRKLRSIEFDDAFRGKDWPATRAFQPAVTVGAGCIWGEVYRAAASRGRAVLGGGCLTVGVAGFVLGGGFGSLSKAYGTGASNLLEAEIVTADGKVRIVNEFRDPELFFALRGGGGGTFGVVTRLTLRTYALPSFVGSVQLTVTSTDDAAYASLVRRMVAHYAKALFNPAWGEQIRFSPQRRMRVSMVCVGLEQEAMEAAWQPLLEWVAARPEAYALEQPPRFVRIPGDKIWNPTFLRSVPGMVRVDDRPGASSDNVYWADNADEAGQTLNAYQSAWLPSRLLEPANQQLLVEALTKAASQWPVTLHFNKGMAGGSPIAIEAVRGTAMNGAVIDAFALLICAADGPPAWPGMPGHEPDNAIADRQARAVDAAMTHIRSAAPNPGSYMSESDYHLTDWRSAYWGSNYRRLRHAKRRYDPADLFNGHHCVDLD